MTLMKAKTDQAYQLLLNTAFVSILFSTIVYLHYFEPVTYMYTITEDHWGEFVTFVNYMLSAGLLVFLILREKKSFFKFGYIALALVMFVIGMEEISWGQRILNIRTPSFITQFNYQSELTVHNIIDTLLPLMKIFFFSIMIWAFIVPVLIARSRRLRTWAETLGIPLIPSHVLPYFIASFLVFIFKPIVKHDEIAELLLSLAFAFLVFDMAISFYKDFWISKLPPIRRKAVFLGVVMTGTAFLVLTVRNDVNVIWRMQTAASIEYPERDLNGQADEIFSYMVSREDRMTPETYFLYGSFLKKHNDPRSAAILQLALESEYVRAKENENPQSYRKAGIIHKMLNEEEKAQEAFGQALLRARERLDKAKVNWEKSTALASMGKTYYEMGDYRSALDSFRNALQFATLRREKTTISESIKEIEKKLSRPVPEERASATH
jgi:hypothetical protein